MYLDTIGLFTANNINNLIAGAADASIPLWDPQTGLGIEPGSALALPLAWWDGANGKD